MPTVVLLQWQVQLAPLLLTKQVHRVPTRRTHLFSEARSFSLFATRRIVELHLAGTKPNAEASKLLQEMAANPLPDTLVLLSSYKIDSKLEKSAWYKLDISEDS